MKNLTPGIVGAMASCAMMACAPPSLPRSQLRAELEFLEPYAAMVPGNCRSGSFALTVADREAAVFATEPPIKESSWRLDGCDGYELKFTLDCRIQDAGVDCRSHEWPVPKALAGTLTRELEVAFASAPKCPSALSCLRDQRCGGDGATVRRLSGYQSDTATRYEATRCGQTVQLAIRCSPSPSFACHVDFLPPRN